MHVCDHAVGSAVVLEVHAATSNIISRIPGTTIACQFILVFQNVSPEIIAPFWLRMTFLWITK